MLVISKQKVTGWPVWLITVTGRPGHWPLKETVFLTRMAGQTTRIVLIEVLLAGFGSGVGVRAKRAPGCSGQIVSFRRVSTRAVLTSRLPQTALSATRTTMVITTLLFYVVAREQWKWRAWLAGPLAALFLIIDAAFFGANIVKVGQGGWLPLVIAGVIYTVLLTWKRGRRILAERIQREAKPLAAFLEKIESEVITRVPGTAIFMSGAA